MSTHYLLAALQSEVLPVLRKLRIGESLQPSPRIAERPGRSR